jgi:methionyl aminopeptidase
MSIDGDEDLEGLRAAGRVVADALQAMRARVAPGVTTAELDRVGADVFATAGARSGPHLAYGFPGVNCISVNDEAVHGIPGPRVLRGGDLVKLDVTAELNGYWADACVTVGVGRVATVRRRMVAATQDALEHGLATARAGVTTREVGAAIQREVAARGYAVCPALSGHGIGRWIHEEPTIPNYDEPSLSATLTAGMVITIEPIVSAGSGDVVQDDDGWTIKTADRAWSAHFEHTVVITEGAPLILTA